MSTATPQLDSSFVEKSKPPVVATETEPGVWSTIKAILTPLASLKLTVALFLMSAFIVFAGTLAQVDADIWEVIHNYFRLEILATESFPWVTFQPFLKIRLNIFFPPSFFPEDPGFSAGFKWLEAVWPHGVPKALDGRWFWFPKGWTIGFVMILNLLSAHLIRFKVQAKGTRLWAGWGVIALGCVVTWLVIMGGSNSDGLQGQALVSYTLLWNVVRMTLLAMCGASLYAAVAIEGESAQRWMWAIVSGVLALATLFAANIGMDDSAMRILYQLVMATLAGMILLAGCVMVFKQKAGIVLLHGGVALLMAYEVLVGTAHVESMMLIEEGKTVNYSKDIRDIELAITDSSDPENDTVTIVPGRLLAEGASFDNELLPFKIDILKYYRNSTLLGPMEADAELKKNNPATQGYGKSILVREVRKSAGTDTDSSVDEPSIYARLTDRSGKDLGTYLLATFPDSNPAIADLVPETQPVKVGDKTYDIALRFKRIYKDYAVTLKDVQKNDYYGTNNPRDYSAFITVTGQDGTSFDQHIWMNNPLRYAGDTMYQHTFIPAGAVGRNSREMTRLQIVTNQGWMAPYVSCMIVLVGMLAQFGLSLLRYLGRRARNQAVQDYAVSLGGSDGPLNPSLVESQKRLNRISWIATGIVLLIPMTWASVALMPHHPKADEMNLREFGRLPMWYRGRTMPIDSFARNALLQLADRETYWNGETPADKKTIKRKPAIEWLLMVMSDAEKAREQHVIRIENLDVLNALDLKKREGLCYSVEELQGKLPSEEKAAQDGDAPKARERWEKLVELATAATKVPAEKRNLFQKKMIEVGNKVLFYTSIEEAFAQPPRMPAHDPNQPQDQMHQLAIRADQYFRYANGIRSRLEEKGAPPLVVPTHVGRGEDSGLKDLDTKWEAPVVAAIFNQFYSEFPKETPPAIAKFSNMLAAAGEGNATKFNEELKGYRDLLEGNLKSEGVDLARTNFEDTYNRFNGFFMASWLYVVAGCLAGLGWLFYPQVFQRASFWMLVAILGIHTAALVGRIYISGRPPVTNLYSASVFIGWATVLGGMVVERMTRLGFGNVVAAAAGFLTLRVADGLAADGDTFVVLEAVLDTQFWLATHVVTITLGYATTYLAGFLGVMYILGGVLTPSLTAYKSREVTRMTYGVLCFATFFSFVGTVLGGLWADDSWGRFWGWDPKENGALIIVLWNCLILHARWGAMIKERGLAVLAVIGNIVVTWSFFGVNELGVGLHSYGFTEGRLQKMLLFCLAQAMIAAIGLLPRSLWWSKRVTDDLNNKLA